MTLARDQDGATIEVVDDGCGLPEVRRAGANGMDSMRARAETIDIVARLFETHRTSVIRLIFAKPRATDA